IILTRAVCAVFSYQNMKISDSEYYPLSFREPNIKVINSSFNDSDFMSAASIERLKSELGLACDMLGERLNLLLLDGSVVLHPSVRVDNGNNHRSDYDHLVETTKKMYLLSLENSAPLAGIVEDSRSQSFIKNCKGLLDITILKDLENVKDTHFLTHCLSVGERTSIFRTVDTGDKVPAELKGFENNLFSFYIRSSEFDRALRIDFVAGDDPVALGSWIASAVFSMSRHNSVYGIPPVIIDADQRAKLSGDELLFVEKEIKKRTGNLSSFSELRRNSRPI
ncbi:MAG: DNA double-strand break repair nuclease NurA, partial [Candidatus Aenigmarchaeota archaeon]|nr:DNA double-strand break repair nuclease NurA [Candidatus Aenigmarchaeota archaeon]